MERGEARRDAGPLRGLGQGEKSSGHSPKGGDGLAVTAEDAEDAALDGHLRSGHEDGFHLDMGRLEADLRAFEVEAFEGSLRAAHEGDDDLSLAGGAAALSGSCRHQGVRAEDSKIAR